MQNGSELSGNSRASHSRPAARSAAERAGSRRSSSVCATQPHRAVALRVDGPVGAETAQLAPDLAEGCKALVALETDHARETGQALDEAGELGLHGPGDLGARVARAQRVEDGQRVHQISQVREAHEQDARRAGRHGRGV